MNDNLPLYLDSVIKTYLELLSSQGMNKEKEQTEELVKYIDKMELQFDELLKEIKEIRTALDSFQNPQSKSIMRNTLDGIENIVQKGNQQVVETKNQVKTTIHDAVNSFKAKGKEALISSTQLLKIKPALESVRKSLFFATHLLDKGIMKTNELTSEIRKAKQSFKNIGLLMFGKPVKNDVDVSKINLIQKGLMGLKEKISFMSQKTSNMIHKVSEFQKPSVRKDLKKLPEVDKKESNTVQKSRKNVKGVAVK